MPSVKEKLLILDLDETLIYATENPTGAPCDFQVDTYCVQKRPHLDAFLQTCFDWFAVAVWTSSTLSYATALVGAIFPKEQALEFLWARERCTWTFDGETNEYYWRKNIKKVKRQGYRLDSIIVIDDSPEKLKDSYGNLLQVRPFLGAPEDDELLRLISYLSRLKEVPDIRTVDKRGWR